LDAAATKPSNIWTGDEEARKVVEQLNRDAGYEPLYAGALDEAAAQERGMALFGALSQANGPFFYRMAKPDEF
jgi:8-hydroxy-5-deazaflavin:NADPH oxidoreductase